MDDSVATTDTGSFSVIAFIKRALQNWTTLLARVPAQGQAVAGSSLPVVLPTAQVTSLTGSLTDGTQIAIAKGAAASGAALSGNPVLIAGSDGTNARSLKTDSSGNQLVVGDVAHDGVDSGSPVKVGGKANSAVTTPVSAGDRVDAWFDTFGRPQVSALGNNGVADGNTVCLLWNQLNSTASIAPVASSDFNNSSYDRRRNNHEVTVLASAARTTSTNSSDITNYNAAKVKIVIDVTAVAGTPSLVFTIKGKSTLATKYFTILASAAITGTGTTVLTVFPGANSVANLSINDFVPRVWRLEVAVGSADSVTYSVDCQYVN